MGHFGEISLILSQIISWYGIIWFKQRSQFLVFSVRLALLALTASLASLAYAFITHDFDLIYVAEHSHKALPWFYRVSALWGGHEGSYLVGIVILIQSECAECTGTVVRSGDWSLNGCLFAFYVQSFYPVCAGRTRQWSGFESLITGSWDDDSPSHSIYWLRGICGPDVLCFGLLS